MSFDLKIIDGDLKLDNGDFKLVRDTEKLIQDILKICLTAAGSVPLNPSYGSYLSASVIGTTLGTTITAQIAQTQLQNSIELLQQLQNEQARSLQSITANEQIGSISEISVHQNQTDPRLYDVIISVITKGFRQANTGFSINTI